MIKKISRRSFLQACSVAAATAALTACGGGKAESKTADAHEAVTFMAPYKEIEAFIEQVHSVYPEVNIEVVPYSGDNTTTCLQNMFAAGDLPDVCTLTYYDPQIDLVSDKLLDLSGYDFTDNYVESRLQDVFDNGAIYLLPSVYNCYGITYNKTLLREHGWELPNSFAELEVLAAKPRKPGSISACRRSSTRATVSSICAILQMPISLARWTADCGRRIIFPARQTSATPPA